MVAEKQPPLLLSYWTLRREPTNAPAIENASHSVELRDASPPRREPARDAIKGGGDDVSILNLLREVVDKTKTTANSIGKTAEVRIAPLS